MNPINCDGLNEVADDACGDTHLSDAASMCHRASMSVDAFLDAHAEERIAVHNARVVTKVMELLEPGIKSIKLKTHEAIAAKRLNLMAHAVKLCYHLGSVNADILRIANGAADSDDPKWAMRGIYTRLKSLRTQIDAAIKDIEPDIH